MEPKHAIRLIAIATTLDPRRASGQLDEAGLRALQGAREDLAKLSGRAVTDAFLQWSAQGRPSFDPRPMATPPLAKEIEGDRHPYVGAGSK